LHNGLEHVAQGVKLLSMKSVQLVVPDLFLPKEIAAGACDGLHLPALQRLLARSYASQAGVPETLEAWLGKAFAGRGDAPFAAIGAQYDGLGTGNWLRADPVHLRLQRDQLLMLEVSPSSEEAQQLCASLTQYFADQGMAFYAPHSQRWYVRLGESPLAQTTPLPALLGRNIRHALPTGAAAAQLHQLFNEAQMVLHAHPLNEAREMRGELPVNSVWLWGEGTLSRPPRADYQHVVANSDLARMFALAAQISFTAWPPQWGGLQSEGSELLVWEGLRTAVQRGDLSEWRKALQNLEAGYAAPLWQALQSGSLQAIEVTVPAGPNARHFKIGRSAAWKFWRSGKSLAAYSIV
jgi:hypothetical protein